MTSRPAAGTWVYAVTDADPPGLARLAGVGAGPVHAVREAGLVAAVSAVDLDEYGEEALRGNLENLDWLEATARAHHAVIDDAATAGPVVPMQLATIYRDDARVAAMLAEREGDLRAALDRIRGRIEWGAKVYLSEAARAAAPPAPSGKPTAAAPPSSGARGSGAAYLQRRRAQLSAREQADRAAAASAEAIHAGLSRLAVAARLHKPQHPQLAGQAQPMILNGAYLVDDGQSAEFQSAADALAGQHPAVRIELTGPWPPYSFTADEDTAAYDAARDAVPGKGDTGG